MTDDDLFATDAQPKLTLEYIAGQIPVLLLDGIYRHPSLIRRRALELSYQPGSAHYPGRIARFPDGDPSLIRFLRKIISLVNSEYLPRLPVLPDGRRATTVRGMDTDFAITDVHPNELTPEQRRPHTDAVPVFGLVYLNEEDRGGTLFFRPRGAGGSAPDREGYQTDSDENAELCGRIEGRFNRLAIYPGFILHSGEVTGDWIYNDVRFEAPRLTQRMMFFV